MFNVIDVTTGWKVDLIIRKDRPFSAEELRRRLPAMMSGVATHVASAEDIILSKLEWSRASGSEHWASKLGVTHQLHNVVATKN